MKILFLTAEGFDTPNPNNQMAETLIDSFLQDGYEVHLIQSHRKGVNPDLPKRLEVRNGFSSDTIVRKIVDKTNFVKRYFNDVLYAFQAMKRWRKIEDTDVVYLQSNPTIIFPMLLLKLLYRKPILYSIYDVFPGHAYNVGVITSRFVFETLRVLQKPCYKMASTITVLGDDMKTKVVEQGAKPNKVFVVPAWYDVSNMKYIPTQENKFIQKYNISPGKFYVQFAGSLGFVFNADTMLVLAENLKPYKGIEIQIIGDGVKKATMEQEAKKRELKNISFYPLQSLDLVADVYSACSICIIPLMKGVIGNGVPSKAALLMACRKVIVNSIEKDSEYSKQFAQYDMGLSIDISDIEGLKMAVLDLYSHPEKIERMAENAYIFVAEHYSSAISTKRLKDIIESLVAS